MRLKVTDFVMSAVSTFLTVRIHYTQVTLNQKKVEAINGDMYLELLITLQTAAE